MSARPLLYVIVCAAGPATHVGRLVDLAHVRGWHVQLIATPAALDFLDIPAIEAKTGRPLRSRYRSPDQPRSPRADAIIVAPATYNTINKWALGISDTYALGILAEAIGLHIPAIAVPFVNTTLADRLPFRRSIAQLRDEGARVLFGPGQIEPHPPGTGETRLDDFPWELALDEAQHLHNRAHDE